MDQMMADSPVLHHQPLLFSDHQKFASTLERYLHSFRFENVHNLGIYFMLMGYFSTMPKDQVYDQALKDHVKILHAFVAGYHDRFFLFFMTKTLISGSASGRLFYFHLNENAPLLDHNFLNLNDLESMLYYLKLEDPNISWNDCAQWMKKIKNQCLFVKVNKIFPAVDHQTIPTFKVDVRLYRMDYLFQNGRSLETKWRKLTIITPDHLNLREIAQFYKSLSETTKITQFYKSVFETFIQNSDRNPDDPNFRVKFSLTKENFLHFFYGASLFNVAAFYPLKITPIHDGQNLDKLAFLILDEKKWVTDLEPVLFEVTESVEEKFENGMKNEIYDLPVDFATNSLKAMVTSLAITHESSGHNLDVRTQLIDIAKNNHLFSFLEKMVNLDPDHFYQNLNQWRKDLILHLNRIDTFLRPKNTMTSLKHFIFASLMALDGGNLAFKLSESSIHDDIFLIKSQENGIVITFSPEIMHETKSDTISELILSTNLKKFVVLTIVDRLYSHDILDDSTFSPLLGMVSNEITVDSTPLIDSSTWKLIRTHFTGNFFTEMLMNHKKQVSRSVAWKSELECHSMLPKFHSEFEAQVKGIVSGKQVFTPYATTLLGFTVEKYVKKEHTLKVPVFVGDSTDTFQIIMHLTPYETIDQDDPLKTMKQYFKAELQSSKSGKKNSALIKVALSNNEFGDLKFNYFSSFPNGRNRGEYELCNQRRKRSGENCLMIEREEEKESLVDDEKTARFNIPRIINTAMYIQMVKGVVGSAIDGDYRRMGKEVGMLAGTVTLSFIGDKSLHWGQNLLKSGNLLKGGSAYLGGILLSKAYLGFIAEDLVSRIKTFNHGDKDQMVGIVGDAALLSINALSTGLELYSTFASIEEASVELGPQVMIAEAIIFAIIDGFYATRSVQKIQEEISLSWGEKMTQWFRSFFGAHPSQYIEILMQEKILLQKTVDDMIHKFSMRGNTIRYYATPSLYVNHEKLAVQREDNAINMNKVVTVKSRVWPESKESFKIECAANSREKQPLMMSRSRNLSNKIGFTSDGTVHESIFCKNMISIGLIGNHSSLESDLALIELGSGDDTATGFQNKPNYFLFSGGKKRIMGGKYADTFLLISNNSYISGIIDGAGGGNILDTSKYLLSESLHYDLMNELLIYSNNISTTIKGMEHVIGRKQSNDQVTCGCRTKFLDLKGGKSNKNPDHILIPNLNCSKNITINLSGYIHVKNFVNESSTIFFLIQNKTTASVTSTSTFSTIIFFLPMKITDLDSIKLEKNNIRIKSKKYRIKLAIKNHTDNCRFIFADNFRVVYHDGYFHADLHQQHDFKIELSENYQSLSHKLKLRISIISELHKQILQIHNAPSSKNQVTHFSNEADYETHVVTNDYGINYIHMNANCTLECRMQDVHVYIHDNKSDFITMDFSAIQTWHRARKMKFSLKISDSSHHKLQIRLRDKYKKFSTIHINCKDSLLIRNSCTKILINVKIFTQLCYDSMKHDFFLRPMPIRIDSSKSVVILSDQDVVQNLAIIINKQKTKMKCRSFKNSLILTNSVDVQNHINRLTLIFIDYFASWSGLRKREMFNSLKLRFENFENVKVENLLEDCHFLFESIDTNID